MKSVVRCFVLSLLFPSTHPHLLQSQDRHPTPVLAGISNQGRNHCQPYVTAGDRAYLTGNQDGNFPDMGDHMPGEMGGLWLHPIKLDTLPSRSRGTPLPTAPAASSSLRPLARAQPSSRTTSNRYVADSTLNEDWASASLSALNSLEHQVLTLAYLRPALDSLPIVRRNRRIFFLEGWLAAFLRGQTGDCALRLVRQYFADHPRLPEDLRRKVLQHGDDLERTVRIRSRKAR
jgi:hypothetical protein